MNYNTITLPNSFHIIVPVIPGPSQKRGKTKKKTSKNKQEAVFIFFVRFFETNGATKSGSLQRAVNPVSTLEPLEKPFCK